MIAPLGLGEGLGYMHTGPFVVAAAALLCSCDFRKLHLIVSAYTHTRTRGNHVLL